MRKNIFSLEELYDLLNAQHSAIKFQNETGISCDWSEFTFDNRYRDKINSIDSDNFERILREVAVRTDFEFQELENLHHYIHSEEELINERRFYQDRIISKILEYMSQYCYE